MTGLTVITRLILITVTMLVMCVAFAQSSYAEPMTIDARLRPNGLRVMFFCKQPISFSSSVSGNQLQVTFNRSFTGSLGNALSKLQGEATSASFTNKGKTIVFTLAPASYKTRKFVSDNFVGVDVFKVSDAPETVTPPAAKTPPLAKAAPLIPVKKVNIAPAEDKTLETQPQKLMVSAPPANKPKPAPTAEKETLATTKLPVTPSPAEKEPAATSQPDITPAATEKHDTTATAAASAQPVLLVAEPTREEEPLPIVTENTQNGKLLIFSWKKDVAAAVFYRAGYLWVVFDHAAAAPNLAPMMAAFAGTISHAEQLPSPKYVILRFKGWALSNVKVYRQHFTWAIEIASPDKKAFTPAKLITEYKTPLTKGIFFPAEKIGDPIRFIDPELEDELIAFPFHAPDYGVAPQRHFPDFTLLKSSQGMIIALTSDNVQATRIASGIEIVSPLTHASNPVILDKPDATALDDSKESIYTFKRWQQNSDKTYNANQEALLQKILASDHDRKSQNQLSLAQFYFSHDLISETLGMLKLIQQTNPPFMASTPAKLLLAATYFRRNDVMSATNIFNSIPADSLSPSEKEEIAFWQSAIQASLGAPGEQLDYLPKKDLFLRQYSSKLRHDFASISLESHMRNNNVLAAEKLIAALEADKPEGNFANNLTYYKGLVAEKKGELAKATKLLEPLTKNIDDRQNRSRAIFSMIQQQVSTQKITPAEAITRLNTIRNTWRGDELERNILKFLGDQYVLNKQYTDALRVWRQVVSSFPNSEESLLLAAKMTRLFIEIFSMESENIPDLKAIALYYEFRDITPIGKMGDLIIQQLAYRLIKLDLLDRAAALLTHQVRYRLKEKERLEFGTKLALIHLMNKKPTLALDALDVTEDSALTDDAKERLYLRAKALIGLKKSDEALKLLSKDTSVEAASIRLDIAWEEEDWEVMETILTPVFASRIQNNKPLTVQESNNLLRLAVSHIMEENKGALNTLYEAYKNRLPKESPLRDAFIFLATDKGAVNYKALDQSLNIAETQAFLDKYRHLIEKDSLRLSSK